MEALRGNVCTHVGFSIAMLDYRRGMIDHQQIPRSKAIRDSFGISMNFWVIYEMCAVNTGEFEADRIGIAR